MPRPGIDGSRTATLAIPETPAGAALQMIFDGDQVKPGFCVIPEGRQPPALPDFSAAPWLCAMTSGTSGAPRLVERTQESWLRSFEQNARMWGIGTDDSYAILGALSHSLSLYAAMEAVALGADLHLLAGLRPDRQAARLQDSGVTILYATPAQLRLLTGHGQGVVLPTLRKILIGGAALDAETRTAIAGLAPRADIHEFYGASETSFVTVADTATPKGSVGKTYPGVNLSCRDDAGRLLQTGETGEIWVESPYLFSRYADGLPGDTRWDGSALTVGEFGHLDSDGNLFLSGRRGRMVTIADQNVFPEEVEAVVQGVPAVMRAAVIAVPDAKRGHILVACVEADGPSDDTILAHCRAVLGPLKAPRRVFRPARWPVLASGKPDLGRLQELLAGETA